MGKITRLWGSLRRRDATESRWEAEADQIVKSSSKHPAV
jgi:hypothetical protein